jgi:hypothetical protein
VLQVTLTRLAPALCAFAIAMASGAQASLWVSPAGDDANPGSEEQPFRTIEHARDVVRTLNHDMADDITVFIAGEQHLSEAIEFGPEDSGSNGFNIVYTAAPGEHPVFNGAIRIPGWSLADKARNLWSAPSPAGLVATHNLFVNGNPATRTKSRLLAVFSKPSDEAPAAAPEAKAQWKNPGDVVFERVAAPAIWSERAAPSPAIVENAFELLGTPGEWYFDRPAHHLYYTPRPGEDMASADVEAAVAQSLVVAAGSKDRPIAGLVFKGIRFEFTTWPNPAGDDPVVPPPGAIRFKNAAGIQFLEDEFLHMSTPALDLGPGIEGGTVEGCLFGDISWSAIRISDASAIRIAESRLSFAAADHMGEGAIDVAHSADVVIDHDQFDHFPITAVLSPDSEQAAVLRSSNRVLPPMIDLKGSPPGDSSIPIPEPGGGISQAYRTLEDEEFHFTTVPQPPTSVSAEAEDEFAYVTWIPSCRDGGSPVEAYTVASSTGAKTTVTSTAFQRSGYVTMNGLGNGHPVSFTVSAANAVGSGPPSLPTANVTPRQKRKLRAPGAPAQVALTPGPSGSTILITPPANDGGSPVVSYLVASGAMAAPIVIEGLDVIRSNFTHPVLRSITGFLPAKGSTVSIIAVNISGEGKPAAVVLK